LKNGIMPAMQLEYTQMDNWPPLSWLAKGSVSQPSVKVFEIFHGSRVETHKEWFCEAIWAGDYEAGDFDRTDIIFGSGGRLRGESVTFVSAGATVDRLHALQTQGQVWVSNSLACLLAAVDGTPDPSYPQYFEDFETITRGIRDYKRTLETSAGPVQLTYYNNLKWDSELLTEEEKPNPARDFSSFAKYREFLEASLRQLSENMAAEGRNYPYKMLGTLSTGYDSPTVVTLAQKVGLREVISFTGSRSGEADSGEEIAEILGVRLLLIPRDAWYSTELPEVPFIASDAKGEDVYFKGAEDKLMGRALLTGFHGDKMWDRDTKALTEDIVRGDQSGLSLTEYRLWTGFIHCPVPFMGVRQIKAVNAINHSPEMLPWDVSSSYSRPICRRIVEEAGVPRDKFGSRKNVASVLFFEQKGFLSPGSLNDYMRWLQQKHIYTSKGRTQNSLRALAGTATRALDAVAKVAPRRLRYMRSLAYRLAYFERRELFHHVFPWAIEHAKKRYLDVETATRDR
jgi:hypothetical protein